MSSGDGKRRRVLSPEERVLWTTVTRSIAPLRESAVGDEESPSTVETARVAVSVANPASRKPALDREQSAAARPARSPHETARRAGQGKDRRPSRSTRPYAKRGPCDLAAVFADCKFARGAAGIGDYRQGRPCGRRRTGRSQTAGAAMAWFAGISRIDYRFRRRARRPWRRGRALRQGATKQTLLSQATLVRG